MITRRAWKRICLQINALITAGAEVKVLGNRVRLVCATQLRAPRIICRANGTTNDIEFRHPASLRNGLSEREIRDKIEIIQTKLPTLRSHP